jgi:transcriptional regulator with GAF, ATPase, and Fis domain
VAINCAALPETLLESELFGYERGAFTGAHHSKAGQIELASGGVLFLDEVSEMSRAAQAKFLRVLQEREFRRLGGTRLVTTNARVIAATNRDLHAAMESGDFREDLYYRLRVFDIRIPPLRERPGDIALLTDAFLEDIGRSMGCRPAGISDEARSSLTAHAWPGNVRELRNVLERATILCMGGLITPEHVALRSGTRLPAASDDPDDMVRRRIEQTLDETDWNISKSAKRLGLTRTKMYGRLRKYQLERPRKRKVA